MNIVRDGNDYEPQQVSRWRLHELLQHEKDNATLRARIAALEAAMNPQDVADVDARLQPPKGR